MEYMGSKREVNEVATNNDASVNGSGSSKRFQWQDFEYGNIKK